MSMNNTPQTEMAPLKGASILHGYKYSTLHGSGRPGSLLRTSKVGHATAAEKLRSAQCERSVEDWGPTE